MGLVGLVVADIKRFFFIIKNSGDCKMHALPIGLLIQAAWRREWHLLHYNPTLLASYKTSSCLINNLYS